MEDSSPGGERVIGCWLKDEQKGRIDCWECCCFYCGHLEHRSCPRFRKTIEKHNFITLRKFLKFTLSTHRMNGIYFVPLASNNEYSSTTIIQILIQITHEQYNIFKTSIMWNTCEDWDKSDKCTLRPETHVPLCNFPSTHGRSPVLGLQLKRQLQTTGATSLTLANTFSLLAANLFSCSQSTNMWVWMVR